MVSPQLLPTKKNITRIKGIFSMILCNKGHSFNYETEKLYRLFFPFEKIKITEEIAEDEKIAVTWLKDSTCYASLEINGEKAEYSLEAEQNASEKDIELGIATALFKCLIKLTGYLPKWGLLTGVRPAKLFARLSDQFGQEYAEDYFSNKLFVSPEKISLCKESHKKEEKIISLSSGDSFSLYVSVPFCPTRCSYCSFVSHSVEKAGKLIEQYVPLLCKEIKETAVYAKNNDLKLKTVYIGGGTPTTLSAQQLIKIIQCIKESFDLSFLLEFTVEAGRPDTVTAEKLKALKDHGVSRISINPQTTNNDVLKAIGRSHTKEQFINAFNLAREIGFDNINTDLIAGLPTDTYESFENTIEEILKLSPESVTVHSLSFKRSSELSKKNDSEVAKTYEQVDSFVSLARTRLSQNGILPYYMYRQSKTVGNLENVGYAKQGKECLYNVYIMDETHTILGCGASAVTKLREPNGSYIERIFNYKYPYEYINNFDEILNRKSGINEFYKKYGV